MGKIPNANSAPDGDIEVDEVLGAPDHMSTALDILFKTCVGSFEVFSLVGQRLAVKSMLNSVQGRPGSSSDMKLLAPENMSNSQVRD